MLRILNKLSGFLLGIFLYPLKSLFVNSLLIILTLLAAAILFFGIPILFATLAFDFFSGDKATKALVVGVVVSFVVTLILPPVTVFFLIQIAVNSIEDFFSNISRGASEGYNEGLFYHILNNSFSGFVRFSSNLQILIIGINRVLNQPRGLDESQLNGLLDDGLDLDLTQLEDVPRSPLEVGNFEESNPSSHVHFIPLSQEEISKAKNISTVKILLDQYIDLHARLVILDETIKQREENIKEPQENIEEKEENTEDIKQQGEEPLNYDLIQDELTAIEITKPSLLVKQYQDNANNWKTIPTSTCIIDFDNLKTWLAKNDVHPKTRDSLNTPSLYDGHKTRYRVFKYQGMQSSQELRQATATLRSELAKLNTDNITAPKIISGIKDQINQTFFGSSDTLQSTANEIAPQEMPTI